MQRVWIIVKFMNKGVEMKRMQCNSIGRVKHRLHKLVQGNLSVDESFDVRVIYKPKKYNEFTAKTKTELYEKLGIFTSADEVRFIRRYWRGGEKHG